MRGAVREAFVHPDKLIYLPAGVEIDVPEDRVAEFARWVKFAEAKKEAETAEKPAPKKAAPRHKKAAK